MQKGNLRTQKAQGTIEYLVIIAVVVVIALVVVGLMTGIFDSNSSNISSSTQSLNLKTQLIAVSEILVGTGTDANGLIVLTNNTGELITNLVVNLDEEDHNYSSINLLQGETFTLRLASISGCASGRTDITKNLTIKYYSQNQIQKTIQYGNIKIDCATAANPIAKVTPKEETTSNAPEEPEVQTDEENPTIELVDPNGEIDPSEVIFQYVPRDNNSIKDCNLLIQGDSVAYDNEIDNNALNEFAYYDANTLQAGDYNWNISCKDYANHTATATQNYTFTIPQEVELGCPTAGDTNIYGTCWSNVIAYYPLDNDTLDYSEHDNNATNYSATPDEGKLNGGYSFDGSSSYLVGTNLSSTLSSNSWTISMWVKPNNLDGTQFFAACDDVSGRQFATGFASTGKFYFERDGSPVAISQGFEFNTTSYQFVTITFDGEALRSYINGVPNTYSTVTALPESTNNLYIGRRQYASAESYFNGSIDEIIIFDKTLSEEEINQLYTDSGGTSVEQLREGLKGYWPLDETEGTTVHNYTDIEGLDGTLYLGGSFTTDGISNGAYTGENSFIRVPTNSEIAPGIGDLTVAYWVNNLGPGGRLISYGNHGGAGYAGYVNFSWADCFSYGTAINGEEIIYWCVNDEAPAFSWPQSEWTQVVTVMDRTNNELRAYITNSSGQYIVTKDISDTAGEEIISDCDLCFFGSCQNEGVCTTEDSGTEIMEYGTIDEIAIWKRALTLDEINTLYNSGNGLSLIVE